MSGLGSDAVAGAGAASSGTGPATHRVSELIGALEALPDQSAASIARELVQIVLDLHGSALATLMEAVAEDANGERRESAIETVLRDEAVEGVLLLHGLHPADLDSRARAALNRLHPHLGVHGVAVEALECAGDVVRIRLGLADVGRYREDSAETIRREIEVALYAAAPDALNIEIVGLPARVSLVPVASISVRRKVPSTAHS